MGVENTVREPILRSGECCLEEAISFLLPLPQVFLLVVMVASNAVNMSRGHSPPLPRSPRMVPGLSPMFNQSPFSQKSRLCSAPKYFWDEPSRQCCRRCPAGHFLEAPCTEPDGPSSCQPCPQDTFLSRENHKERQCSRCQACDEDGPAHQVVIRNCSIVANTQCGCAPGWFPECSVNHCRSDSPFLCLRCRDCEILHRYTQIPCSREDTVCGKCLPGFCQDLKNNCVPAPCPTLESEKKLSTTSRLVPYPPSKPKSTSVYCGNDSGSHSEICLGISSHKQGIWFQYFLVVPPTLTVLLLLGWGLFYIYRKSWVPKPQVLCEAEMETLKRQWILNPSLGSRASLPQSRYNEACALHLVGTRSPSSPPLAREVSGPEDAWPVLWGQPSSRGNGPGAGTLQPGPQLYEVMDAVPARRWKEFVRTLGLREAEIEAVEAEIGRFRDQQYEMLKRWRQQQPAGLGAVYAALERMGLEGCAEDLRSRLQRGP
ncbi:tumor necrosis factor receptor superfamily member 25 isoform X2 [Antechinus flavipes]|uniref:tumor necrosis factor receptor superfamily member 25 isoform X2 n=1 Tax=Antechinus flavipes TaxID=38775 RepID=UPI0022363903|nr:tumor necrosis factor receptor superfamily member 25 isoform X2 [Antechinus flavipes]